jgi:hypothetical protein
MRRTANEIDRTFICPYDGCTKFFGSEGRQNLHIKIKHNGGSKTDRERLAKTLVKAFASKTLTNEIIDSVDLNLPPGVITKMAQKSGLIDKVNEVVLMETINRRLAPKFREMLVLGQLGGLNKDQSGDDDKEEDEEENEDSESNEVKPFNSNLVDGKTFTGADALQAVLTATLKPEGITSA